MNPVQPKTHNISVYTPHINTLCYECAEIFITLLQPILLWRYQMSCEYGFTHSTPTVGLCWKCSIDEPDKKSYFMVWVAPSMDGDKDKQIWCEIDNRLVGGNTRFWNRTTVKDVLDAYNNEFYEGGDDDFNIKAKDMIRHVLRSELRTAQYDTEIRVGGGINAGVFNVKGEHKRRKEVKDSW